MAGHHAAITAAMSSAPPGHGGAAAASSAPAPATTPRWKLESSFQPKSSLKVDSKIDDFHCWEREFKAYFDMSNLQNAEISIQRTVLLNCLDPDFQTKISEAMSGVTTIKAGLDLVRQEAIVQPIVHLLVLMYLVRVEETEG